MKKPSTLTMTRVLAVCFIFAGIMGGYYAVKYYRSAGR